MNEEIKKLVLRVADGNPGAMRVIEELTWFNRWSEMLRWLELYKYTGAELWTLYKDEYHENWSALGQQIELRLRYAKDNIPCGGRCLYPLRPCDPCLFGSLEKVNYKVDRRLLPFTPPTL